MSANDTQYYERMQTRIEAAKRRKSAQTWKRNNVDGAITLAGSIALIGLVGLITELLFDFQGTGFVWFLVFAGAGVGTVVWTMILEALVVRDVAVACPYCDEPLPFYHKWECGWCYEKHDSAVMADNSLFEPCTQCGKEAVAVPCPHCNNDVVFDADVFNSGKELGTIRRKGVAIYLPDKRRDLLTNLRRPLVESNK